MKHWGHYLVEHREQEGLWFLLSYSPLVQLSSWWSPHPSITKEAVFSMLRLFSIEKFLIWRQPYTIAWRSELKDRNLIIIVFVAFPRKIFIHEFPGKKWMLLHKLINECLLFLFTCMFVCLADDHWQSVLAVRINIVDANLRLYFAPHDLIAHLRGLLMVHVAVQ